jgi:hypothetical protein
MAQVHRTAENDLPITVPDPLVEITRPNHNQEGKDLAGSHSSDEKAPYDNEAYVTDLEASRSPSDDNEVGESKLSSRISAFRRSKTWSVMRDMFWIALLVSRDT